MRPARLAVLSLVLCNAAFAQVPAIPRTAEGRPDLQGIWTSLVVAPLERRPGMALVLSKADAEAFAAGNQPVPGDGSPETPFFGPENRGPLIVRGEYRSSLIIDPADGKLPYSEFGRGRRAAFQLYAGDENPEERGTAERCQGIEGPPSMSRVVGNYRQIVQTADSLVIQTDYASEIRIVPLDGRPPGMGAHAGLSAGRWEGDVLVIETTGFPAIEKVRAAPSGQFAISPQTRITERLSRISPDEISYVFTIEDPALYTQPWTGESVWRRGGGRIYEFACHEGNYALGNILRGARAVERRSADKRKP
jgi:hypothetical protein